MLCRRLIHFTQEPSSCSPSFALAFCVLLLFLQSSVWFLGRHCFSCHVTAEQSCFHNSPIPHTACRRGRPHHHAQMQPSFSFHFLHCFSLLCRLLPSFRYRNPPRLTLASTRASFSKNLTCVRLSVLSSSWNCLSSFVATLPCFVLSGRQFSRWR